MLGFDSSSVQVLHCPLCQFLTRQISAYLVHCHQAHTERIDVSIYQCSHCMIKSTHKDFLLEHIKLDHSESSNAIMMQLSRFSLNTMAAQPVMSYRCMLCPFMCAWSEGISAHYSAVHSVHNVSTTGSSQELRVPTASRQCIGIQTDANTSRRSVDLDSHISEPPSLYRNHNSSINQWTMRQSVVNNKRHYVDEDDGVDLDSQSDVRLNHTNDVTAHGSALFRQPSSHYHPSKSLPGPSRDPSIIHESPPLSLRRPRRGAASPVPSEDASVIMDNTLFQAPYPPPPKLHPVKAEPMDDDWMPSFSGHQNGESSLRIDNVFSFDRSIKIAPRVPTPTLSETSESTPTPSHSVHSRNGSVADDAEVQKKKLADFSCPMCSDTQARLCDIVKHLKRKHGITDVDELATLKSDTVRRRERSSAHPSPSRAKSISTTPATAFQEKQKSPDKSAKRKRWVPNPAVAKRFTIEDKWLKDRVRCPLCQKIVAHLRQLRRHLNCVHQHVICLICKGMYPSVEVDLRNPNSHECVPHKSIKHLIYRGNAPYRGDVKHARLQKQAKRRCQDRIQEKAEVKPEDNASQLAPEVKPKRRAKSAKMKPTVRCRVSVCKKMFYTTETLKNHLLVMHRMRPNGTRIPLSEQRYYESKKQRSKKYNRMVVSFHNNKNDIVLNGALPTVKEDQKITPTKNLDESQPEEDVSNATDSVVEEAIESKVNVKSESKSIARSITRKCPTCNVNVTGGDTALGQHLTCVHGTEIHCCPVCQMMFMSKSEWQRHKSSVHPELDPPSLPVLPEADVSTEPLNSSTGTSDYPLLTSSGLAYSKQPPMCNVCGKRTLTIPSLEIHMKELHSITIDHCSSDDVISLPEMSSEDKKAPDQIDVDLDGEHCIGE